MPRTDARKTAVLVISASFALAVSKAGLALMACAAADRIYP